MNSAKTKRRLYAGSLLGVMAAAYGGAAQAQQACDQQVRELRNRLEQRQEIASALRARIQQSIDAAQQASSEADCARIVADARAQLDDSAQRAASNQQPAEQPQSRPQPPATAGQSAGRDDLQARSEQQAQDRTRIEVEQPPADVNVQTPEPNVNVQERSPQVTVRQPGPEIDVQVRQPEPEVAVQNPPPEVAVNQGEPQVTVQQPKPEVEVTQGQPNVDVQTPEPEVTVRRAEPQVEVERGRPEVNVTTPDQDRSEQQARETQQPSEREQQARETQQPGAAGQAQQRAGARPQGLTADQAEALLGKSIVGPQGELGKITGIVRDRGGQDLYALVEVSPAAGAGNPRTVTVALDDAEVIDGALHVPIGADTLESLPDYDPGQFAQVAAAGGPDEGLR